MAEEIRFFQRIAVFGILIGVVYWFVSYEIVGTVLLLGFGIATGLAFVVLRRGEPRPTGPVASDVGGSVDQGLASGGQARETDGPFGDESGPVPTRSAAPVTMGLGIALIGLSAAFGPWFAFTGLLPLLIGAADWVGAARRELNQRMEDDRRRSSRS